MVLLEANTRHTPLARWQDNIDGELAGMVAAVKINYDDLNCRSDVR